MGWKVQLENGSGSPSSAGPGAPTIAFGAAGKPVSGQPCVISVRYDVSNTKVKYHMRSQQGTVNSGYLEGTWTPTGPLVFNTTIPKTGGIDLCGAINDVGALGNQIIELVPPGFIIHEVLGYPKFHSDVERDNVLQWCEDKYGV
jgi:hypothetical protein